MEFLRDGQNEGSDKLRQTVSNLMAATQNTVKTNSSSLSNLELKSFQESTIEKMLVSCDGILLNATSANPGWLVLKSPTGSGKTIMLAEFLKRFAEIEDGNYVFVWLSVNDLHTQSMKKVGKIVGNRYDIKTVDDLTADPLNRNTILFSSWHKLTQEKEGKWSNVHVRKGESRSDLGSIIDATKAKVILIVDESHKQAKTNKSKRFVAEILKPVLTIGVSATPESVPSDSQIQNGSAAYVGLTYQTAIEEELLKKETVISPDLDKFMEENPHKDINTALLELAFAKREELVELYKSEGSNVNPMVLIQLPDDVKGVQQAEQKLINKVKEFYKGKGITDTYGDRLAVWLDKEKSNLNDVEINDNPVEAMIFKTAVATGWDCPRASILVMFRDMKSEPLKIQTVGRVLRMPEAKHYRTDALNKAYLYTALETIEIYREPDEPDVYSRVANLSEGVLPVVLPSVMSHKPNQITLTLKFEDMLAENLKKHFNIDEDKDSVEEIYRKIDTNQTGNGDDDGLELRMDELQKTVIANSSFIHPDAIEGLENLKAKVKVNQSAENMRLIYNRIMRQWAMPYIRNSGDEKISRVIEEFFGLAGKTAMTVRYITCSKKNQAILEKIVHESKEEFRVWWESNRGKHIREWKKVNFTIGQQRSFTYTYVEQPKLKKYAYSPAYLQESQSKPELAFQELLEANGNVKWWFKNNDTGAESLGIPYKYIAARSEGESEEDATEYRIFRPDYIVMFNNGTIGVYETKSDKDGGTDKDIKAKADALQDWLEERRKEGLAIEGGIVDAGESGTFRVFKSKDYSSLESNSSWVGLTEMVEQNPGSLDNPYKSLDLYNVYDKPEGYRPILDPRNILLPVSSEE